MSKQQQIQIQFKLNDVRQVQFVTLCNEWPEGELQVGNQINFSSDTQNRLVRCLLNIEYKKNDIKEVAMAHFCKNNRTFALTQPYMKHAGRATITL